MRTRKTAITILLAIQFSILVISCDSSSKRTEYRLPAEFENTNYTCFIWSTDYYEIIPRLISMISRKDSVKVFTNTLSKRKKREIIEVLIRYNCDFTRLRLEEIEVTLDNVWIRDFGPVYIQNRAGDRQIVRFKYFWKDVSFMEQIEIKSGLPSRSSELNSTGGSRECNGKGTLLLCEAHELDVNHQKSLEEIEAEMKKVLNIEKVIWLKKGVPQDDSFLKGPIYGEIYPKGVNGHIDEFCRFADSRTILISSVSDGEAMEDPVLAEAKKRLDENYEILVNSTDQDGKKFKVIKVPIAPVIISDRRSGPEGQLVASVTSYMNFILTNSLIILPSYISDDAQNTKLIGKEKQVNQIFSEVFPRREIIKLRADTINYYSGGFHCLSIHEPAY